jgi:hypothetical protein
MRLKSRVSTERSASVLLTFRTSLLLLEVAITPLPNTVEATRPPRHLLRTLCRDQECASNPDTRSDEKQNAQSESCMMAQKPETPLFFEFFSMWIVVHYGLPLVPEVGRGLRRAPHGQGGKEHSEGIAHE